MHNTWHRRFAAWFIVSALALAAACGSEADLDDWEDVDAVVPVGEDDLRTNSDPNRLVVYSNNIENMLFDWKDLVYEMERHPLRPDLFLVQQLTDRAELERILRFMNQRLGVRYEGVVAQNRPDDLRWDGKVKPRPTVTTGIIYRAARFDVVSRDSWMPFGRGFKNGRKTCDERSNNSGYETLRLRLHDRRANKDVVAVSLRHWTWHACSLKNVEEIVNGNDGGGKNNHPGLGDQAALHIVAGDFNDRVFKGDGDYDCWYRRINGALGNGSCGGADFGFTDPLFRACGGERSCVRNRGGIDSIFVRRSDGGAARTSDFDIIGYEQAHRASVDVTGRDGPSNSRPRDGYNDVAGRYSGHEARRAYVYYR